MEFPSPTPRRVARPSWLDLRLVLGVALVVIAVLLGAVVVARARHTDRELAVTHDLAAGTTIRSGDVHLVDVKVPDKSIYLADLGDVIGKTLNRPLAKGELVPAVAVGAPSARTTVSIPFAAGNAPSLARGQRIVVWLSSDTCAATVLAPDVAVQDVTTDESTFGTAGSGQDVVVSVAPDLAQRIVSALALDGATIRAGVVTGPASADPTLPPIAPCASGSPTP